MKYTIIFLSLYVSLAQAEIFSASGSLFTGDCYYGGASSESVERYKTQAKEDACAEAKRKCLVGHGESHPDDVFHCVVVATEGLLYGNFHSLNGYKCQGTERDPYLMGAAQFNCTAEVVPGL